MPRKDGHKPQDSQDSQNGGRQLTILLSIDVIYSAHRMWKTWKMHHIASLHHAFSQVNRFNRRAQLLAGCIYQDSFQNCKLSQAISKSTYFYPLDPLGRYWSSPGLVSGRDRTSTYVNISLQRSLNQRAGLPSPMDKLWEIHQNRSILPRKVISYTIPLLFFPHLPGEGL